MQRHSRTGRILTTGVIRVALTALALVTAAARAAEFHISPSGNDANPGTKDQPFATPARAVAAVRTLVAGGLNRDVRVVLHGGTYALEAPLGFQPGTVLRGNLIHAPTAHLTAARCHSATGTAGPTPTTRRHRVALIAGSGLATATAATVSSA